MNHLIRSWPGKQALPEKAVVWMNFLPSAMHKAPCSPEEQERCCLLIPGAVAMLMMSLLLQLIRHCHRVASRLQHLRPRPQALCRG